jgi:hypothetical protein
VRPGIAARDGFSGSAPTDAQDLASRKGRKGRKGVAMLPFRGARHNRSLWSVLS